VAERFLAESSERCPGEPSCERFQAAAGDTREDKLHACISCPLLPTKPSPTTREIEDAVDRIERLARERDSGRRVIDELSPLEWELLLIWDRSVEEFRRARESQLIELMKLSLTRGY